MKNKNIPILAFLALSTSLTVGCSKKENEKAPEVAPEIAQEEEQVVEEVKIINVEKQSFDSLADLRSFSKKSTSDFSKFLNSNKIENVIAADGSLVTNKNMTYEKYTKNFNQLAYTHVSTNYNDGVGYLKSGIKIHFHKEEVLSTSNNFAKAIFTIVNNHNPNITEEIFNEELKNATQDSPSNFDYSFNLDIDGMSLNVYTRPEANERELVLSIRQELEFPKIDEFLKEYKTVKEFKEDSAKIVEDINKKIELLDENLKNSYVGKADKIKMSVKSADWNDTSSFEQSFNINYSADAIDAIPDAVINSLYECMELLMTKEKLSKIISAEEFKAYFRSFEIYAGLHTTGSLIDETGEAIQINSLPFASKVLELNAILEKAENKEIESDENSNTINKYNHSIQIKVNVPVQAEGIRSL